MIAQQFCLTDDSNQSVPAPAGEAVDFRQKCIGHAFETARGVLWQAKSSRLGARISASKGDLALTG